LEQVDLPKAVQIYNLKVKDSQIKFIM